MVNSGIDMLHGKLSGKLLRFTAPIALSSILQQLFNAADTSVVGRFGSADALAAVGTNAEIVALVVTLSSGLALGANILAAKEIGRGELVVLPVIAKSALLLAGAIGILALVIGQAIAVPLLRLIHTPQAIFRQAELYLRIYFLGSPMLLLYDFGAAFLRATGDSRYPFLALALSGVVNVVLNLMFVLVFHMDVAGVAAATVVSTGLAAWLVLRKIGIQKISVRHVNPGYVREILRQGIPAALQGAVFCLANIFVQSAVNTFGPAAIGGSTIAMNFEYFTYYVITAFGQTATTFTSQNHSAGNAVRCQRILWLCLAWSILCSSVLIFPIVFFRSPLSGLFSTDPMVLDSACQRIVCILLFEPVCNLYEIPAGVLRGLGRTVPPAVSTMVGTCFFRILWIYTVFRKHPGLETLYRAFPISWLMTILLVWGCFLIYGRDLRA